VAHGRGALRGRLLRQATTVAVVLSLIAAVAVFVSWRAMPDRYRSTATVSVGPPPSSSSFLRTPTVNLEDPQGFALAPGTRRAALVASHLVADDRQVEFRVTRSSENVYSLQAEAPEASVSATVTRNWVSAVATARRADLRRQIREQQATLNREVVTLDQQLRTVDEALVKLDPVVYKDLLLYDNGVNLGRRPPLVPERGSPRELNLAFERVQLLKKGRATASRAAGLRIAELKPDEITKFIGQTPATHVDQTPPATVPALAGWLAGVVLVLAGAFMTYRLRTRSTRHAARSQ
jgi:hypothetical protein